ncbi:MAG TPA: hypothetical protein DCQ93_00865 [Bacteroidetes bacterium]|mgnify:CR=1 FL=1|nr:hypothetical protein [Bacteroidota bacterium]
MEELLDELQLSNQNAGPLADGYYRNKQDGYKKVSRKIFLRSTPRIFLIMSFVVLTSLYSNSFDLDAFVTTLPLVLILFSIVIVLAIRNQKKVFESYLLYISPDSIIREQLNTPTAEILHKDVQEIIKDKSGIILIKGKSVYDRIIISDQIDNSEILEESLQKIKPIVSKKWVSGFVWLQLLFNVISFLALGVFYKSEEKIFVLISATVLAGISIWTIISYQRSKNISYGRKNNVILTGIFLLFIITMTLYRLST